MFFILNFIGENKTTMFEKIGYKVLGTKHNLSDKQWDNSHILHLPTYKYDKKYQRLNMSCQIQCHCSMWQFFDHPMYHHY